MHANSSKGNAWTVTIPENLAPGNYVLRHEILALHSAGQANGAQFYPQCINLEVTGSGSATPDGVAGTSLYTAEDPGVLFNLYGEFSEYPIPGPALWTA
jgi:cellulase